MVDPSHPPLPARRPGPQTQLELGAELLRGQLQWVLDALAIDCVLDVGANGGQFAGSLREAGYAGRIVSFEPVAATRARLVARAADDPRWLVVGCALGEVDGIAEIHADPVDSELSSLLPASEFGGGWKATMRDVPRETVDLRRLDGLWEQVTEGLEAPRVLLKLDTQGYDLAAFRGAGDRVADVLALLSEVACVPIYDAMPRWPEQLAAYEAAGFELSGLYPVSYDVPTLRVIELDALLVRASGVMSGAT